MSDNKDPIIIGKGMCNTISLYEQNGQKVCCKRERSDKETNEENDILVEARLIQYLSNTVPNIPVPQIVEINEADRSYSYVYIEGIPLDKLDLKQIGHTDAVQLFTDLGEFHASLAKCSKEEVITIGINEEMASFWKIYEVPDEEKLPKDFPGDWVQLITACKQIVTETENRKAPQLIHGDAHNENIFVTSSGKLFAIIDFGDAVWSDAHHDFVSYIHAYPELWQFSVRAYEEATGQNLDHRRLVALTVLRHLRGLINLWVHKIDKDHVTEKFNYYIGLLW